MTHRKGLYRSRKKMVCGVCAGIAEYFDASTFWIRAGVLLLTLFTGIWPVIIGYFITALILKPSPVCPIDDDDERDFYEAYMRSPDNAASRIKHQFDNLDRRIRRMEDAVTTRAYEWDQKLKK